MEVDDHGAQHHQDPPVRMGAVGGKRKKAGKPVAKRLKKAAEVTTGTIPGQYREE
jgi:hypothetical protein